MIDVIDEMLHPQTLPLLKFGRHAHYTGSIDKTGGNADWDWELYRTERGESVLFEQFGPGCVCNFVQHRFLNAPEPTFRFYFDGESVPRFTVKPSEFGEKYPFIPPLADKFIGPEYNGQFIRVIRSFVPMPFVSSCKITSDIPLFGNAGTGGGWGHVVYHTYSEDRPAESFNPSDSRYRRLFTLYGEPRAPLRPKRVSRGVIPAFSLSPKEEKMIFSFCEAATVTDFRLTAAKAAAGFPRNLLLSVWIKITFDEHEESDLSLPLGCFFGNELGHHAVRTLYTESDGDGRFRFSFPMPFRSRVKIVLTNTDSNNVCFEGGSAEITDEYNELFAGSPFGYLMSTPYYPRAHTPAADSIIADISGVAGHVISSTVTGTKGSSGSASCEGDVRIHFDGIRTPQIQSDGSESYACYGWGFSCPPQCNPFSCYDGRDPDIHTDWCMTRCLPGDFYPFNNRLRFGIESFGHNDEDKEMFHSGAVLMYGNRTDARTVPLARFRDGEEELTAYFEGNDDKTPVTLRGTRGKPVDFTIELPHNFSVREIVLRRVSDQSEGRQAAKVFVNGRELPLLWYVPDRNPCKRWLEDEYVMGANLLTEGELSREKLNIRVEPVALTGCGCCWNQFGIEAFGVRK